MKETIDYISILGPTASGKSRLALMLADMLPIEIISVDSVSVYQGLDIGSAKPTRIERGSVPHHLIDICDLSSIYTAGQFLDAANNLIVDIQSRGKLPVFCGGTLMYMKALQKNYQNLPVIEGAVEESVALLYQTEGVAGVFQALAQEDPVMAAKLHPNDSQRLQRALAVVRSTGRSLQEFWKSQGDSRFKGLDFLLLVEDRARHKVILEQRIEGMLQEGFEDECRGLLKHYGAEIVTHPVLKSIGYREMLLYCKGEWSLSVAKERMLVSSSQFVKRQMTWLNRWDNARQISSSLVYDNKGFIDLARMVVETVQRYNYTQGKYSQ